MTMKHQNTYVDHNSTCKHAHTYMHVNKTQTTIQETNPLGSFHGDERR